MKSKEEILKAIREMVAYIIDTDDKEVINEYADTFFRITEEYADQKKIGWYKKLLKRLESIENGSRTISSYIREIEDKIKNK